MAVTRPAFVLSVFTAVKNAAARHPLPGQGATGGGWQAVVVFVVPLLPFPGAAPTMPTTALLLVRCPTGFEGRRRGTARRIATTAAAAAAPAFSRGFSLFPVVVISISAATPAIGALSAAAPNTLAWAVVIRVRVPADAMPAVPAATPAAAAPPSCVAVVIYLRGASWA